MKRLILSILALTLSAYVISAQGSDSSYPRLSESVTELVTLKYNEMIVKNGQEATGRKQSNRNNTILYDQRNSASTLVSLLALEKEDVTSMNSFVNAVLNMTPELHSFPKDVISFYLPPIQKELGENDAMFYLFIDEECFGVGSASKGLYSSIPCNCFDDGLHHLLIVGSQVEEGLPLVDLFSSLVLFDIKDTYIFSIVTNRKSIAELKLES